MAGSQLVVYFDTDDAHSVQSDLASVLEHALDSKQSACLEVATGCVVAYITFSEADQGCIERILGGLARKGMQPVTLCYIEDPVGQSGYLKLTGTGAALSMSRLPVACRKAPMCPECCLHVCKVDSHHRCRCMLLSGQVQRSCGFA